MASRGRTLGARARDSNIRDVLNQYGWAKSVIIATRAWYQALGTGCQLLACYIQCSEQHTQGQRLAAGAENEQLENSTHDSLMNQTVTLLLLGRAEGTVWGQW